MRIFLPLPSRLDNAAAFSLIEVLVVVAVAAILMALAVPATSNLMAANNVTRAGQQLNDQIALARQLASTRGQSVRVVFYKPDSTNFSAIQLLGGEGFSNALTRPAVFPETFALVPDLSPLLNKIAGNTNSSGNTRIAGQADVQGLYLTIRANGRVEPALVSGTDNYVTVARNPGTGFLTNNFTAVAIDPLNARTTIYRP